MVPVLLPCRIPRYRMVGSDMSTPAELVPISEQVLAWVAYQRQHAGFINIGADNLRRIELCSLATREAAFLHSMYPGPDTDEA